MPGWRNHKLEPRLTAEISTTFDIADDTILMAESEEDLKRLLRMKEESEKAGLKLNTKKLRPWHPAPLHHGKQMGEKRKQ